MTDETPEPAVVVEGTDPPGSGTDERDAMVAALEAQIKALENVNEKSAAADMAVALKAAQTKIEGMEATVATLTEQITAMDHDAKVKELQAKYEALARQPVVHTVVSGAIAPGMATMQPIELDSDEFPAHLARDMEG